MAGLIKVILALQHRTIPPHLHFQTPSPHIAWADLPLQVSTKEIAWEPIGGRRIGGVSSFGFSGTNAHVVLEEAPPCVAAEEAPVRRSCLLALSARDDKAFVELASRFADGLGGAFRRRTRRCLSHRQRRSRPLCSSGHDHRPDDRRTPNGPDCTRAGRGCEGRTHCADHSARSAAHCISLHRSGCPVRRHVERSLRRVTGLPSRPSIGVRNCSHRILSDRCSRCCFRRLERAHASR